MPKLRRIGSQTVDTIALTQAQQRALTEELYSFHLQVFEGVDRACFSRYVIAPPADQNLLTIYRDASGNIIGYCSLQRRDLELSSGRHRILRGVLGFLPEHRGKSLGASFYAWHVVKHTLTAWARGMRCSMLGTPVGPLMYLALARAMGDFWPHPQRSTPPSVQRLMEELSQAYQFEPPLSGEAGCCRVGWVVQQGVEERERLHAATQPELRFYLRKNPGYQQGDGLIMLVPFHAKNLIYGLRRALRTRRRRHPSTSQAPAQAPTHRTAQ